uniref:Spindle pole body component 110-like n=1 Tax=Diabrotica virgifera virgifera TaxID=50390 RepID=A0A6P7H2N3_DIAVI
MMPRNEDNKLDQIIKMMHDLTTETKNLTTEVKEIKNEQRKYWEELNDLKTELEKVKQENQTKHKEKEEMKKELNYMKIRVQRLEKERKVNNVVIQGLPIDTIDRNALKQTVGSFMEKEMNINVQIEEVIKLGEKTCLVKLQNKFEKEKIMQNKAKLKHIKGNKVYINNDITKEELQTQKKIRQVANEEINKGKSVTIKYNKLIIDGKHTNGINTAP